MYLLLKEMDPIKRTVSRVRLTSSPQFDIERIKVRPISGVDLLEAREEGKRRK